ncbi:MAG: anthranilate synthase component I family protein [Cytophagales bacterium]|nr:anthranilate synthase component I family protein [Cytophagales bacterium]
MKKYFYSKSEIVQFKQKSLRYACQKYEYVVLLEPNQFGITQKSFPCKLIFASSCHVPAATYGFDTFCNEIADNQYDYFGFMTYSLMHGIEGIAKGSSAAVSFPDFMFFVPEYEITFDHDGALLSETLMHQIELYSAPPHITPILHHFKPHFNKNEYVNTVHDIQRQIINGNIYEINFCNTWDSPYAVIDPINTFFELMHHSPMPFAAFLKYKQKYCLCASPERFLHKNGNNIISQPIKGTSKRGKSQTEDNIIIDKLLASDKEYSENIMITDLVRNDLSKIAARGTVTVSELCKLYTYSSVHQLITTVSCICGSEYTFGDIIKAAFPMGSMTGAPKYNAIKLIQHYEKIDRGLFSGSIGYVSGNKDFDFNVVIRSIFYDEEANVLTFSAGSGITAYAHAYDEWDECITKIQSMIAALGIEANKLG